MKYCLIGHRGCGKSTLLREIQKTTQDLDCFDLDTVIEKNEKKAIQEIFHEKGEEYFRELEEQSFLKLSQEQKNKHLICLGAGFDPLKIPKEYLVIFIYRKSDQHGRIFYPSTTRPRLEKNKDPLTESQDLFKKRNKAFLQRADYAFEIPEGPNSSFSDYIIREINNAPEKNTSFFTLLPEHFQKNELKIQIKNYLKHRIFSKFELRDDLLNEEQILCVEKHTDLDQRLYAFRKKETFFNLENVEQSLWDWDLHLGKAPLKNPPIVSSHLKAKSLEKFFKKIQEDYPQSHIKCAWSFSNWQEALNTYKKCQSLHRNFSFLPRSSQHPETFSIFRLFLRKQNLIHFSYTSLFSSKDQTTYFEENAFTLNKGRALVLGSPVEHSYSPSFHEKFFKDYSISFHKASIPQDQLTDSLLELFITQKVYFMAITSPHKKRILESKHVLAQSCSLISKRANTLIWSSSKNKYLAFNTDYVALKKILKKEKAPFLIYGNGSMSSLYQLLLKDEVPVFSARQQKQISGPAVSSEKEYTLLECSSQRVLLPEKIKIKKVIDCSYKKNSSALQWAEKQKATYESGLFLFKEQALLQQMLFKDFFCKKFKDQNASQLPHPDPS